MVLKRPHRVLPSYKSSGQLSLHLHLVAMRFHSVAKVRGNQHPTFLHLWCQRDLVESPKSTNPSGTNGNHQNSGRQGQLTLHFLSHITPHLCVRGVPWGAGPPLHLASVKQSEFIPNGGSLRPLIPSINWIPSFNCLFFPFQNSLLLYSCFLHLSNKILVLKSLSQAHFQIRHHSTNIYLCIFLSSEYYCRSCCICEKRFKANQLYCRGVNILVEETEIHHVKNKTV